ncbi:MAG: MFS transporter [Chloroflexota bacterium]
MTTPSSDGNLSASAIAATEGGAIALSAERPVSKLWGRFPLPFYYGWIIVGTVFTAEFTGAGVGTFVTPLFFAELRKEMGWSLTMLTGALTAQTIVNAGMAPVMGRLLDRIGARPVVLFGTVMAGLGLLALTQIQEIWQFWFLYATVGALGLAEMGGLSSGVLITKWFVRFRGRALSIATLGTTIGGMVMAPVVGTLITNIGWRGAWGVLGVYVLVVMVPVTLLFVRRQPEDMGLRPDGDAPNYVASAAVRSERQVRLAGTEDSWTVKEAMRTRTLWYMVIGFNLVNVSANALVIHLVPFLTLQEGLTAQMAAYIVTVRLAGSSASRIIWGFAADWFPMNLCLAVAFGARALGPLSLALLPYPSNVVMMLVTSVLGGGFQVLQPLAFANYFGRANAGAIQGAVRPLLIVSTLSGPLLIAVLFDRTNSFDLGFLIAGGLAIASIGLAVVVRPPARAAVATA